MSLCTTYGRHVQESSGLPVLLWDEEFLMTKRKRIVIVFGLLSVLLVIAEIIAWRADAQYDFRRKLLEVLVSAERREYPVGAQSELPWDAGMILVRLPKEANGKDPKLFKIGNRIIPDSEHGTRQHRTFPEDMANITQKRIFIGGGSAAFGMHYPMYKTFTGLLGGLMEQDGYVVLNAAQPAWCSGEVVPLVKRITDLFLPDTIIIMSGNNEFLHWLDDDQPWVDERIIRSCQTLANSRLMAGWLFWTMRRAMRKRIEQDMIGYEHALSHPASPYTEARMQKWLETKKTFLEAYAVNLGMMVAYAKQKGVRVVLLTMPFNYRLPVSWKHPQPESCVPENADAVICLLHDAVEALEKGDDQQSITLIEQALALDSYPPILYYIRACAHEHVGRFNEAELSYAVAREHMVGNLGSCLSINNVIHSVGRELGVPVLDVQRLFDDWGHANNSYFNEKLIHDDCHPTPLGHALIAKALTSLFRPSK